MSQSSSAKAMSRKRKRDQMVTIQQPSDLVPSITPQPPTSDHIAATGRTITVTRSNAGRPAESSTTSTVMIEMTEDDWAALNLAPDYLGGIEDNAINETFFEHQVQDGLDQGVPQETKEVEVASDLSERVSNNAL